MTGFFNAMKKMTKLTPRLALCARFASGAKLLCDVGTDHGYLPISLLEAGKIDGAVAADIRSGPLASARRHALDAGCEEKIRFFLADGLGFPGAAECDTVVCASMGGETIEGILSRAAWTKDGVRLILQPQSKLDELCEWLRENGYALEGAALAAEGDRLYVVLRVIGGSGGYEYAEDALEAAHDALLCAWLDFRINKLERALSGMLRGGDTAAQADDARRTLTRLQKYSGGKS